MARDLLPMVRQALSGRYEIDREIGRGGAARVFAARASDGRLVALKVLHPQLAASVAAERFFREIHHLAPLEHPNIARLIDYGEEDWVLYYVMDYVEGPTLKQHLQGVRRAGIGDTLRIARDVLDALGCAHDRGIVHRDVKPENILLSPKGAVLVDFGIARAVSQAGADRLTRSGFAVGTSSYMSPEQIAGSDEIDARSDIYSLGCVLFECLAGRPPYEDPYEDAVLRLHQTALVPTVLERREDTPPALAAAILRSMAKDPAERWPTAQMMRAALPELEPSTR